jgi:hypothetical protein
MNPCIALVAVIVANGVQFIRSVEASTVWLKLGVPLNVTVKEENPEAMLLACSPNLSTIAANTETQPMPTPIPSRPRTEDILGRETGTDHSRRVVMADGTIVTRSELSVLQPEPPQPLGRKSSGSYVTCPKCGSSVKKLAKHMRKMHLLRPLE